MSKVKALIFDYGGTLDTGGCHWGRFIWHGYEEMCIPISWEQYKVAYVYAEKALGAGHIIQSDYTFRQTLQRKLQMQIACLREKELWNVTDEVAQSTVDSLLQMLYNKVGKYTFESKGVLKSLGKSFPMALVTNFYGNIEVVLNEFDIANCFCHVVESAKVGVRKPNPAIFKLGVEALEMKPEEVLVVGDSMEKDIIPAKQSGCKTACLKGETWEGKQHENCCADYVISHLSQLTMLLKNYY